MLKLVLSKINFWSYRIYTETQATHQAHLTLYAYYVSNAKQENNQKLHNELVCITCKSHNSGRWLWLEVVVASNYLIIVRFVSWNAFLPIGS